MYWIRIMVVSVLLLSTLLPSSALSETKTAEFVYFPRNLSVGASGDDVQLLQKILNSKRETRITYAGAGSLGFESNYYGPKTAAAVKRFQEYYRNDILTPSGLIRGTGSVGLRTRYKLESLVSDVIPQPTSSNATSSTAQSVGAPYIMSLTPNIGTDGTMITITGGNFSETDNNIFTEYGVIRHVPSLDGKTLQFQVKSPFPVNYRSYFPNYVMKVFVSIGDRYSNFMDFTITN